MLDNWCVLRPLQQGEREREKEKENLLLILREWLLVHSERTELQYCEHGIIPPRQTAIALKRIVDEER